ISSVILIWLGTGPVKGFGVSLTIGILASMFTALVVTRLIFDWLLEKNLIRSLNMLHLIRGANFDFMRWAVPAFIASWTLILIGNGYGLLRGKDVMGVDFAGGDSLTLTFTKKVEVDALRKAVEGLHVGDSTIQYQKDPSTGKETLRIIVRGSAAKAGAPTQEANAAAKVKEMLATQFNDAGFKAIGVERVGAVVGREIQENAVIASLLAMFGILLYVAFRYEFSFAVGAVIAILHDVLMTMCWFFLTGRDLSA